MIVALVFSVIFSLVVGIVAARNHRAETVIIPLLDVLQSIPILGFFPFVTFAISGLIPGPVGYNLAVIFLIFTSMSWNIAFGVYEAVKSIPQDYIDLSYMSKSSSLQRITSLYIPASLSRIAYNAQTSWAVGLFYLVSSEIIIKGVTKIQVRGIGVDIITYGLAKDFAAYFYSILLLVIAVIIWQFIFLREFSLWAERYKFVEEPRAVSRDPLMKFYHWVNQKSVSKLFLLRPGRGVTSLSSSVARYRRGLKYAFLILFAAFLVFELGVLVNSARTGMTGFNFSAIPSDEATVVVALAYSFARIWYVYFICVAVAVPLGIVIALHERLYTSLVPVIEVVASIPAPILLPALVPATMIVGSYAGELTASIVILTGMIWYVLFNVMAGIRTLPAGAVRAEGEPPRLDPAGLAQHLPSCDCHGLCHWIDNGGGRGMEHPDRCRVLCGKRHGAHHPSRGWNRQGDRDCDNPERPADSRTRRALDDSARRGVQPDGVETGLSLRDEAIRVQQVSLNDQKGYPAELSRSGA